MTDNELRDFTFENYYKRIGILKERSYYSMKRKESFLRNKNIKSVKQK